MLGRLLAFEEKKLEKKRALALQDGVLLWFYAVFKSSTLQVNCFEYFPKLNLDISLLSNWHLVSPSGGKKST